MKKKTKDTIIRYFIIGSFLILSGIYVAKQAGASILRLYVESGIGSCQKVPIMCVVPDEKVVEVEVSQEYLDSLVTYDMGRLTISVPKLFKVTKQKEIRKFYKKWDSKAKGNSIYMIHQPVDFFINLYSDAQKWGVKNDYDFISNIMYSRMIAISNLQDAFYVIMKGVFTPDLGSQANVKIVKFQVNGMRGFVSYNLEKDMNYFNCDVIDSDGYYKVYIKDKGKTLDLEKVISIVSTLELWS